MEIPAYSQCRQKPIYLVFIYLKGKTKKLVFWLVLWWKVTLVFARYLPYTNTLGTILNKTLSIEKISQNILVCITIIFLGMWE
jgi:hypothetical protein